MLTLEQIMTPVASFTHFVYEDPINLHLSAKNVS